MQMAASLMRLEQEEAEWKECIGIKRKERRE